MMKWLCLALTLIALPAQAQKTLRLVVPFGAGGGPDVLARLIAPAMSESLGVPVVVDNRPGAGGIIAAEFVKQAAPDGMTLFVADSAHYGINPSLRANLPYDPQRDFVAVVELSNSMIYVTVGAQVPAKNVQELVALAKSRPEGLPYGSSGAGSVHHLSMELLKLESGANFVHVPFKGVAQSVPAALSGDVPVVLAGPASLLAHVRAGKLRMIAAVNPKRWSRMPDVPTMVESGYSQFAGLDVTIGLLAPAGTPPSTVRQLNQAGARAVRIPEVTAKLADLGLEVIGGTPDEFARSIQRQRESYGRLVKVSGAKAD
jgi:tripartite-type tricarboxylate transporter receptor subunit TctC